MGLLSSLLDIFRGRQVGLTEPICPYCEHPLDKMPGRKKKCPACGNSIYVRTRPRGRVRILVREDQLLQVEELWAIANGTHRQFLAEQARRKTIARKLQRKLGREPSKNEVEWEILDGEHLEHAKARNWGLYRNARFGMAEICRAEQRDWQALDLLLEVCYFDLNGPTNKSGIDDPKLLREFPVFDRKLGFLAPGVLSRVEEVMQRLGVSINDLEGRFTEIATAFKNALKMPVSPKKAWRELKDEIAA